MPNANPDVHEFIRLVVSGGVDEISRALAANPGLATAPATVGAQRQTATDYFFPEIAHYLYAGDTALHLAAAAFRRPIAELLVAQGADVRARNRRGAEPLHYAADTNHWDPTAQAETIAYLISAGADPNAIDKSGTAPLHRAVRTRSSPAVKALLDGGADPSAPNGSGSTPLDLAVRTTGRGGSGSDHARAQQEEIVRLLRERVATPISPMKQLKGVFPIGSGDAQAIPVKAIGPAAAFYTRVLGFTLVAHDDKTAVLHRDDARIGLVADPSHDPKRAGSFYFDVVDLEALRREFIGQGAKPGAIGIQSHEGKKYRVFFLRECDMMDIHDGYCFCFGQPA